MSCYHQAHCHQSNYHQAHHQRLWIGSTLLLGVAACVSIASLQALSQSDVASSDAALSHTASYAALRSVPNSGAAKIHNQTIESIASADWQIVSCNNAHPVLCIYTNRGLANQIKQEFATTDRIKAAEQPIVTTEETAEQSQRFSDATALKRTIQFLTHLKTWLDTVS